VAKYIRLIQGASILDKLVRDFDNSLLDTRNFIKPLSSKIVSQLRWSEPRDDVGHAIKCRVPDHEFQTKFVENKDWDERTKLSLTLPGMFVTKEIILPYSCPIGPALFVSNFRRRNCQTVLKTQGLTSSTVPGGFGREFFKKIHENLRALNWDRQHQRGNKRTTFKSSPTCHWIWAPKGHFKGVRLSLLSQKGEEGETVVQISSAYTRNSSFAR